uniref:Decapping nuclease n=1 Tax=Steinernema glaseri TaxID=37863 RepID=A0A1I8AHR2_9BILA
MFGRYLTNDIRKVILLEPYIVATRDPTGDDEKTMKEEHNLEDIVEFVKLVARNSTNAKLHIYTLPPWHKRLTDDSPNTTGADKLENLEKDYPNVKLIIIAKNLHDRIALIERSDGSQTIFSLGRGLHYFRRSDGTIKGVLPCNIHLLE